MVKAPYGYVKSGKTMVIDPSKAAVVRKIFNWYIEGISIANIVRKLKELEIQSPNGAENWSITSVTRLLKDRTYIGEYRTGIRRQEMKRAIKVKEEDIHVFINHHEPIISEADFGMVQYAFEIKTSCLRDIALNEEDPDQLRGLTKCAVCGRSLVYVRKNPKGRVTTSKYFCKHHTGENPDGVRLRKRLEIDSDTLKDEVVRQYNKYIERVAKETGFEAVRARRKMEKDLRDEIELGERLLDQYRKDLLALYEQYVAEEITKEAFAAGRDENYKKREDASKLIEKYKVQLTDIEVSNARMKGVLTLDEKIQSFDEKAIRQAVTEVLIDADGNVEVKFKRQKAIEEVEKFARIRDNFSE